MPNSRMAFEYEWSESTRSPVGFRRRGPIGCPAAASLTTTLPARSKRRRDHQQRTSLPYYSTGPTPTSLARAIHLTTGRTHTLSLGLPCKFLRHTLSFCQYPTLFKCSPRGLRRDLRAFLHGLYFSDFRSWMSSHRHQHHRHRRYSQEGNSTSLAYSASPDLTTSSLNSDAPSATVAVDDSFSKGNSSALATSSPSPTSFRAFSTLDVEPSTISTRSVEADAYNASASASAYSALILSVGGSSIAYSVPTTLSTSRSRNEGASLTISSTTTRTPTQGASSTASGAYLSPSGLISSPVIMVGSSSVSSTSNGSSGGGLSTASKAVLGGVLGGLGGLGLVCALVLVLFAKGNKRMRPESAEALHTPQRMGEKFPSMRSSTYDSPSRFAAALSLSSARRISNSTQRTRKNSEPPSPVTDRGFQVISGRRLSSPPSFHAMPGEASRMSGSVNSSPRSAYTTPSRRSRLGGTPIVFRDPLGRSQDGGSTVSHISRFVERLDDAA